MSTGKHASLAGGCAAHREASGGPASTSTCEPHGTDKANILAGPGIEHYQRFFYLFFDGPRQAARGFAAQFAESGALAAQYPFVQSDRSRRCVPSLLHTVIVRLEQTCRDEMRLAPHIKARSPFAFRSSAIPVAHSTNGVHHPSVLLYDFSSLSLDFPRLPLHLCPS